jgi:ribosomal protein L11 methyltransferase
VYLVCQHHERRDAVLARSSTRRSATGRFDLVVANILRAVLLEFAPALARLHARGGTLVLSGLVSTDVPEVSARYAALLGGVRPEVYEREDWRAVVRRG